MYSITVCTIPLYDLSLHNFSDLKIKILDESN